MNLFYSTNIDSEIVNLSEEEAKHCTKVLRLKNGDKIHLTDGKGNLYESEIIEIGLKKCSVKIVNTIKEYGKRNYKIHIAIAPTKNIKRIEWFLEKATEIGIDEITPLICEHSERREIKTERLNKVISSAVKQSLKAYHPKLNVPAKFSDFIDKKFKSQNFIAYCENDNQDLLKDIYKRNSDTLILIGPEGDFSDKEIQLAKDFGYTPISFGKSRLRTETAGIVACHTINLLNEEK